MTARWVVDEVKDQRDLQITWQPFSLLLKNQPAEGTPYYDGVLRTYKMLRVMESVRATEGNDGVFALYWELGARIHHDKDRDFDIADALEAAGLPATHAEAFEDERFDTEIRSRHDAGLALTGDDVGTPIIDVACGIHCKAASTENFGRKIMAPPTIAIRLQATKRPCV